MSDPKRASVPAFLSIDVEPDAFQIATSDEREWAGYSLLFPFVQSLRDTLAHVTGVSPNFGWYFRMDPQIEKVFGRADVAISGFRDREAALLAAGDYFGVHSHPLRWSAEKQAWIHDFGDPNWVRECTAFSLDSFESCTGTKVRLFRVGAGFMSNEIVDVLDERGVDMELGLEPLAAWGPTSTFVPTAVDSSAISGQFINCREAPLTPYQPARKDFRQRGTTDTRRIVLVPLSSGRRVLFYRGWKRTVAQLLGHKPDTTMTMLYPTIDWPSARYFWDIVANQLDTMTSPYLSLAVRTDGPGSEVMNKVCSVLAALPNHPVAKRLRFVNPLSVRNELTPA